MTQPLLEQQLVERLQARDESAVADLEATYGSRIYQLAFRYMKNREDAEEVAQDVLWKVYRKIDAFRGDAALSSWIYRITFNTAMSRLRAHRQTASFEGPFKGTSGHVLKTESLSSSATESRERRARKELADWSMMADDEMLRGQLRKRLIAALKELPAIYRLPILLRDIHGLTTEEASAVLRIKDQTLKSRLHRGRLMLRDRLADFADGLSLHRGAAQMNQPRALP